MAVTKILNSNTKSHGKITEYSNHFICSMLSLSVLSLFFLTIEQSVLMVLVFYEKCMLEKVMMQRTPKFAEFSLLSKESS